MKAWMKRQALELWSDWRRGLEDTLDDWLVFAVELRGLGWGGLIGALILLPVVFYGPPELVAVIVVALVGVCVGLAKGRAGQ